MNTGAPSSSHSFRQPPTGDTPVLVLSGTLDGRTYIDGQAEAVAGLSRAHIVTVHNAVATRVHQLEVNLVDIADRADPIARHAGRRLDDTRPLTGQPVEQAAFPDIGTSHDGNNG